MRLKQLNQDFKIVIRLYASVIINNSNSETSYFAGVVMLKKMYMYPLIYRRQFHNGKSNFWSVSALDVVITQFGHSVKFASKSSVLPFLFIHP